MEGLEVDNNDSDDFNRDNIENQFLDNLVIGDGYAYDDGEEPEEEDDDINKTEDELMIEEDEDIPQE